MTTTTLDATFANDPRFVPPPATVQAAAPRVTGTFFGVEIPADITFFDARFDLEAHPFPRDPATDRLIYGRGAYALGLGETYRLPYGIQGHTNSCEPHWTATTADWVARLIAHYREAEAKYRAGEGLLPLGIELDNYGGHVIAAPGRF